MTAASSCPKVRIIIVNYNGSALLQKHLPSVLKTDYANFNVVIVDNGSVDDSVRVLVEKFPSVKIIKKEQNLGFACANNSAFRICSDCDYFVLLNNDMEVTRDWLTEMIALMGSDPKIAAVGPRVIYAEPRDDMTVINSAGGIVDRYDRGFDRFEGCEDGKQYDTIDEVDFVSGGAMVLRKSAVDEVDGFDERMFFYYEDVDLCLRLRKNGWKIVYDGRKKVVHDHMGTSRSWGTVRRTLASNFNRIKSIQRRKGVMPAAIECVRSPLEWLLYSLYGKIAGKTYRAFLTKGKFKCRSSQRKF